MRQELLGFGCSGVPQGMIPVQGNYHCKVYIYFLKTYRLFKSRNQQKKNLQWVKLCVPRVNDGFWWRNKLENEAGWRESRIIFFSWGMNEVGPFLYFLSPYSYYHCCPGNGLLSISETPFEHKNLTRPGRRNRKLESDSTNGKISFVAHGSCVGLQLAVFIYCL